MTACLAPDTVQAFLDGATDDDERATIETHVDLTLATPPRAHPTRSLAMLATTLVAAACLGVYLGWPSGPIAEAAEAPAEALELPRVERAVRAHRGEIIARIAAMAGDYADAKTRALLLVDDAPTAR